MLAVGESGQSKVNGTKVAVLGGHGRSGAALPIATGAAAAQEASLEGRPAVHGPTGLLKVELRGRVYQARWAQLGTVEHLRVNVRVESANDGTGKMHVETLDLYSPRSRSVFAARAGHVIGTAAAAVEEDLSELLVAVDRVQREVAQAAVAAPLTPAQPVMPDAERTVRRISIQHRDQLL